MDSPSNPNLEIWDALKKTDPDYVKEVKYGKRKYHTANATWQQWRMTQHFGPIGKGWGCSFDREVLQDVDEVPVIVTCSLWYINPTSGDRVEVPPRSTCVRLQPKRRHDGEAQYDIDEDALKKAETEAISKSLSTIGMSADIFLGLWDDNKYVMGLQEEKRAAEKADAKATQRAVTPADPPPPPGSYPDGMDPGKGMATIRRAFEQDGTLTAKAASMTDDQFIKTLDLLARQFFGADDWFMRRLKAKHPKYITPDGGVDFNALPPKYLEKLFLKFCRAAEKWRKLYGNWTEEYPEMVTLVGFDAWVELGEDDLQETFEALLAHGARALVAEEA